MDELVEMFLPHAWLAVGVCVDLGRVFAFVVGLVEPKQVLGQVGSGQAAWEPILI